ncbi:hypothetical protein IWX49DRAFT_565642, partial [Phyllosticta citricarpa]
MLQAASLCLPSLATILPEVDMAATALGIHACLAACMPAPCLCVVESWQCCKDVSFLCRQVALRLGPVARMLTLFLQGDTCTVLEGEGKKKKKER